MIPLQLAGEVAGALADRRGVVALESSLIAHGLPPPHNLDAARGAEEAVRAAGAVPATVALVDGRIHVGADGDLLARLAGSPSARDRGSRRKVGVREIAPALASRALGATTVSASVRISHLAGIRVFATGGIGGVHRGASSSFDVSADIDELAATPVAVVCSGAKSLLDLPATLELLETRRIPVVGFGTDELPAFYAASSGLRLADRVDTPDDAAGLAALHLAIQGNGAILFVQPPPPESALERDEIDELVRRATAKGGPAGVRGADVTPRVLARVAELSGGRTLETNVALIVHNAATAGRIAVAMAARRADSPAPDS